MKSGKGRKGQAALEFLTTYGWALMAMSLVIGTLSYFDLLSVDRYISESCDTGSQVQCLESMLELDGGGEGTIGIVLRNNYPVNIRIEDIIVRVDGETYTRSVNTVIDRGQASDPPIELTNLPSNHFSRGSKKTVDLTIQFRRETGGARTYDIRGQIIATAR